ncbi:MAG: hypothetical protein GF418_01195 [Chitinivibrionales bacterium]|nr:hypothetical protein [Chitinivibrionales bacterium]MBD3394217.1 hypothetical protein [Chitinivibrionales bacterium]
MRTLVYHAGALGDFITILPALAEWRRRNPDCTLVLLGRPAFAPLAAIPPAHVWDIDRAGYAPLFRESGNLPPALAASLGSFPSALLFARDDSPLVKHVRAFVPTVHHQPPFPDSRIPIGAYRESLLPGPFGVSRIPALPSGFSSRDQARELIPPGQRKRTVVIHPGSGSARKNWPFERFLACAGSFRSQGLSVAWIAGPAEEACPVPPGDILLRNLPLPAIAEVLRGSCLYLGNDSGISHLAAAAGCRSVVLFGASDAMVWRPAGQHVTVVSNTPACSPCHPGTRPQCDNRCMHGIPADQVLEVIRELLNADNPGDTIYFA